MSLTVNFDPFAVDLCSRVSRHEFLTSDIHVGAFGEFLRQNGPRDFGEFAEECECRNKYDDRNIRGVRATGMLFDNHVIC